MLYGSNNYGAVLQAYALAKVLSNMGYEDVEQILYDFSGKRNIKVKIYNEIEKSIKCIRKEMDFTGNFKIRKQLQMRNKVFYNFVSGEIPTSKRYYNENNLKKCKDIYDCIIVGSDQVWSGTSKSMLLSFFDKKKVAYAASIARDELSADQVELFKKYLPEFHRISVREVKAQQLLEQIEISSETVLDPTLLLKKADWERLCINNIIKEPFILCYFLSDESDRRKRAEEYAKKYDYKIVTFPYMEGVYNSNDALFGDYRFFSASPFEFISLIRDSEAVFTDSFHASVFSCVFDKPLIVFDRAINGKTMSSRIMHLLALFGRINNYDNNKEIKTMENKAENNKINIEINRSLDFLRNSL